MLDGYVEKELALINQFTRRKLEAEDVYVFTVILCDNDIDKDNEAFSLDCLFKLENMFVGKTGILSHNPEHRNHTARIFVSAVENVPGRKNKVGDDYYRLVARAFMPIKRSNLDVIQDIDNDALKEISLGCSVGKRVCSICGRNIGSCRHEKGKMYNGKLCYVVLDEPIDAYEWAIVAKPVVKRKKPRIVCWTSPESAIEQLKSIKHNSLSLQKAIERATAAIQLQYIGKEPLFGDNNGFDAYTCPECMWSIQNKYQMHCDRCGQKLDWWRYKT